MTPGGYLQAYKENGIILERICASGVLAIVINTKCACPCVLCLRPFEEK